MLSARRASLSFLLRILASCASTSSDDPSVSLSALSPSIPPSCEPSDPLSLSGCASPSSDSSSVPLSFRSYSSTEILPCRSFLARRSSSARSSHSAAARFLLALLFSPRVRYTLLSSHFCSSFARFSTAFAFVLSFLGSVWLLSIAFASRFLRSCSCRWASRWGSLNAMVLGSTSLWTKLSIVRPRISLTRGIRRRANEEARWPIDKLWNGKM
mmetsp:Transcript_15360/g.36510  ORF Transcript_15360/g.36510 Transcript_15360/m.36510 type:complete len:213 (-) Transcript_15360:368-1006(-)